MRIYSGTSINRETGDLDGYELAIDKHDDLTVDAFLYVYEGAPNDQAIPISGTISGNKLRLQGNWEEHLIEYPSRKEVIQTHFVRVDGALNSASFRGLLKIEGMFTPESVRLKRVPAIWECKR